MPNIFCNIWTHALDFYIREKHANINTVTIKCWQLNTILQLLAFVCWIHILEYTRLFSKFVVTSWLTSTPLNIFWHTLSWPFNMWCQIKALSITKQNKNGCHFEAIINFSTRQNILPRTPWILRECWAFNRSSSLDVNGYKAVCIFQICLDRMTPLMLSSVLKK